MGFLIVCAFIWIIVLVTIPPGRIKKLRHAAVLSFFWMLILDNLSSALGFYSFQNTLVSLGRAPLFQLLAYPGIGLLMLNWLTEKPISKLLSIVIVASCFSILQYVYIQGNSLQYGSFDMVLSFIYSIAALSVYVWLSLVIVGEHNIYSGNKTRAIIKGA